ncbi:DUF1292 domain-containing protein [Paenibacillus psychroresistens]|uniref:DUF1292 domain-containing protein n=1 Tax=Paenibacillus psychroresistens TaxID=1778678 RepID=A0A6B8RG96_9BACL|nr:DUF1292 domain-containing protein [Paenibacillus psychroresistens]QGQ95481.1 DUF1292 domain-containing protein [Paenibacillus psychroresistens]
MDSYQLKDLKPIHLLQNAFGTEIELEDGNSKPITYRILAEFSVKEKFYAVLESVQLNKNEEISLFYINENPQGELELETIMDDDEWEAVAELYDELTVTFDE